MAGNVVNQIFDSLIGVNNETGELEPSLATEWSVSEDGLEYTFTLREGVTFHDSTPFNAEDVVATFEAGKDPANAYASAYENVTVEAGLGFLGLSVPPNVPSWGNLLAVGRESLLASMPWLSLYPGLAIAMTALGINLWGDWLRDALDPRMRR